MQIWNPNFSEVSIDMRKLIVRILQLRARWRLARKPGVNIHSTAKVNYRGVRLHADCSLVIGEGSIVEGSLVSEREGVCISIGRNTFIGSSLLAGACRIEIGDDVLISWGCNIVDHNSHAIGWTQRKQDVRDWYHNKKDWTNVVVKPVRICDKAWLGLQVIVLKGVEIGEGAVVAAGSVVTKSVPPWTVVAGNPAKVIREISIEDR
jgi:acetyltransferase-like isoleucine patch superfamily enzyme